MKILGVDPGSSRCGFGLIEKEGSRLNFLTAGLIENKESDINYKLFYVARDFDKILLEFQPDLVAIEKIFFSKNVKTAIEVAQARGVLILQTLKRKIQITEYNPQQIKQAVTSYGMADKKSVAKMVALLLRMPSLNVIDDTTDALAIAITAAGRR